MSKEIFANLTLPVIAAPMFRVSGPELVIASCNSGIIGSFPSQNCRTVEELDNWLSTINMGLSDNSIYGINLVMRNERLLKDLDLVIRYKVPIVITSVGSPGAVIPAVHSYGGLVFSDVATLRHAQKAVELGVDGLILLCAGAGGNSGWNNPFAFVRAVREFYDGILVLAGSIMDGTSVRAAEVLGADLVYMGTRFISTNESMALPKYKEKLISVDMDDVMTTKAFSGMPANYLRTTIEDAGFDPNNLPAFKEFNASGLRKMRWKTIWSAGHGVGAVKEIKNVKNVVNKLEKEYSLMKIVSDKK